jgi:hypothetical protein
MASPAASPTPNFAGKAPPEVVAECKANLAEAEAQASLRAGACRSWDADGWRI